MVITPCRERTLVANDREQNENIILSWYNKQSSFSAVSKTIVSFFTMPVNLSKPSGDPSLTFGMTDKCLGSGSGFKIRIHHF